LELVPGTPNTTSLSETVSRTLSKMAGNRQSFRQSFRQSSGKTGFWDKLQVGTRRETIGCWTTCPLGRTTLKHHRSRDTNELASYAKSAFHCGPNHDGHASVVRPVSPGDGGSARWTARSRSFARADRSQPPRPAR